MAAPQEIRQDYAPDDAADAGEGMGIQELLELAQDLERRGDVADAEAVLRGVLVPTASAHAALAADFLRQRDFARAEALFRAAIYLEPGVAGYHAGLSTALLLSMHVAQALEHARAAIAIAPQHLGALEALGAACYSAGLGQEAQLAYRAAADLEPLAPRWENLGSVLRADGALVDAVEAFQRAVDLDPKSTRATEGLVATLHDLGRFHQATAVLRRAPEARPGLLMALADPVNSIEDIAALFQAGTRRLGQPSAERHSNTPDRRRRLRLAYLSADLRDHSVSAFLLPILRHHDRSAFEILAYYNSARSDAMTEEIKALVDSFTVVRTLNDDELEARIRADKVDILIDPSGFTAGHRLGVVVRKPAPITACIIGYPAAVDVYLTDPWADPQGMAEQHYPFDVARPSSTFQCFEPPRDAPDVVAPPVASKGVITFGSFNALFKLNDDVLRAWAAVLQRVPESRLIIKTGALADERTRDNLAQRLVHAGAHRERFSLLGQTPSRRAHLAAYGDVDIALDTFPFNGSTTTCEALWMGVPLVTYAGATHVARSGLSILANIGLKELVAEDTEGFVRVAAELAGNVARLTELRRDMRQRMIASPLVDGETYTRGIERALRERWSAWCESSVSTATNHSLDKAAS